MFKWENDNWWLELLRLDELGLPESWNFVVPDKLMHTLMTFCLAWLFAKLLKSKHGTWIGYAIMMLLWEVLWDGCFRYGASWKDMIANTVGFALAYWWLGSKKIGQQDSN
jgi:VanZ family protein